MLISIYCTVSNFKLTVCDLGWSRYKRMTFFTDSESPHWGGSNDVYIVWLLIKFNEATFNGQLWPLFLTGSGQNGLDGWRSIQIWNPLVEAVLMMCIYCMFGPNWIERPVVTISDHCFRPKVVKTGSTDSVLYRFGISLFRRFEWCIFIRYFCLNFNFSEYSPYFVT